MKAANQSAPATADALEASDETAPEQRLRVVLVDDDAMARRLVRDVLQEAGVVVIAEASGGREGVELCLYYTPAVVVMDVAMPGMDGLEATRQLLASNAVTKVVMLTSCADDEVALQCLQVGAVGFVSKDIGLTSLPRVIEAAHRGEAVVSRRMTMRLIESVRSVRPDGLGMRPIRSPLTSREWEVLDLLCEGQSTDDIATGLVLSVETVRSHVKNVLRKLDVRSRQEAVDVARQMRRGFVAATDRPADQPAR